MVIASRILKLKGQVEDTDIPIRLYLPEQVGGSWSCRYEIDWPDRRWSHAGVGADSVQAILIAMQLIGTMVYNSDYHRSGKLMLDGPNLGYGFPLPKISRDMLIGDDAKFF